MLNKNDIHSSRYSRDFYRERALSSLQDYRREMIDLWGNKINYLTLYQQIDSVHFLIDSLNLKYNTKIDKLNLVEYLELPSNFKDTIDDWVLASKTKIDELEAPSLD